MDVFCVFFLLSLPIRLSFVSVVFDFNDSQNDFAPVSPMLLSICVKRNEKSNMWMLFVCLAFTTQIKFRECCV